MTLIKLFETCATSRGYTQNHGVDYKLDSGVVYFRQSKESIDWVRNVLAVIPWIVKLDKWRVVPLGAWLVYRRVRFLRNASFDCTCGISQGGWPAVMLAQETGRQSITFGCPCYCVSNWPVESYHYETPTDFVCNLPPWADKSGIQIILKGTAVKPEAMTEGEWLTGHTLAEYRQRIGG